MKKRIKKLNWPRMIIQWGVIAFILFLIIRQLFSRNFIADFEAYCPFGGIQALGSYMLNQALSCTMTSTQIAMGILLFVTVLIFSKLFCSFICPVGTVSEWLGKLGKKMKVRFTLKGVTDKILRSLKYILLFITIYFTFQSNELFCKKFDPYYAAVTGFDSDVVIWYAVISIFLVIAGSIFIRLFWCKYICPLGALSNIFKYAVFFIAVLAVYIIALRLGAEISYVWPLAVLCAGGYIFELIWLKSRLLPVFKITRNTETCTDCQLCTKKCPQAIDVASVKSVRHIDCNLCSDCILACPVKNTLQINKTNRLKWLAPVAVVLLVITGMIAGTFWEVPTIDQKWGDDNAMSNARVYEQAPLKNIKCFGSSSAFANQMKRVDGVLGVATYVKHHRVKIYYDPAILDSQKIQQAIFTPSKVPVSPLPQGVETVTCLSLKLENFFDTYDFNYLTRLLAQKTNAVGLITEYGCPIIVKIFFPGDSVIDEKNLIKILESKSLTYEVNNVKNSVKLGYKVASKPEISTLTRGEYISQLFKPYNQQFNDRKAYSDSVLKIYQVPLGKNGGLRARFSYLVSHLSNDDGIVEFRTVLDSAFREQVQILFVDSLTNPGNIMKALASDSLKITYTNGKTGSVPNMFQFEEEGILMDNATVPGIK
jgi:polyferredoxin